MNSIRPSTSPNSVISKATIDGAISELRHVISKLCMSEVLEESEMVVIQIERFWHEAYMKWYQNYAFRKYSYQWVYGDPFQFSWSLDVERYNFSTVWDGVKSQRCDLDRFLISIVICIFWFWFLTFFFFI